MIFSELFRKISKLAWFLPGFLLWAAYPPMGERTDVLFALAPLMWLSRRADARTSAKRWFQSGVFYWVATLSWMPAIVKNGGPWPLVVLGWFALAAYCAAYFAAYGYLSSKIWRWARSRGSYVFRLVSLLLLEPVLWCGLELVRSRFLGGFSWNQLGVVPVNSGFGAPAAIGGVYLCSAVVILVNGTIAGIAERVWKPEESGFKNLKKFGFLETLLALGVVWGVYGMAGVAARTACAPYRDGGVGTPSRPQDLKVALVQRDFPCCFKAQEERPLEVYERLLSNVAELKPDLVVLPESAMCEFGPVDQQGAVRFAEWAFQKTGAALLAGGTRYADGLTYNSAALYQPSSTSHQPPITNYQPPATSHQLSVYDKVHLVPFGEFIPGDKLIPALQQLAPVGSCTPGELKALGMEGRETGDGRLELGVAICFEDTDSKQMRELAKKGAQALVFMTNDSWFSHSIEAEQHAWQAVARAIETGLPVVRVGNSGVTGTIAPDGRTSWLVGPNGRPLVDKQGTMFDRITYPTTNYQLPTTIYVALGDMPLATSFALLILGMILVKYKHYYEKRRTLSV